METDPLIREKIQPAGYEKQGELLRTLPAVRENAATVWAERGPDPAQYPNQKHLGSWCGLCPGNNGSAGRNKSPNQGNKWLRAALTGSAGGVARMKAGHWREKFWRMAARGEPKRSRPIAVVAIAHDLLKWAYFVLQRGTSYEESRGNVGEQQKQRWIQHHIRRLGKLGIPVRLSQPPVPRPASLCPKEALPTTDSTEHRLYFRKNPKSAGLKDSASGPFRASIRREQTSWKAFSSAALRIDWSSASFLKSAVAWR